VHLITIIILLFEGIFIFLTAFEIPKVFQSPLISHVRHTIHVKRVVSVLIKIEHGFPVFYRDLMNYWNWQKRVTIAMLICWCETYMVVITKCWDCLVTSLHLHLGKLCTATRIAISMQVRYSAVASM
jgi:hypothetical protein